VSAAQTTRHRVWQRMPQGWIEFRALGDRTPDEWLERYLASGDGWLPDEARAAITQGFHAGVRMFADIPFDFAGVSIVLGERPAVSFLCTHVVASTPDEVADSVALHRLLPLGRFGDDSTAETFTSPDGRVGTVTSGALARGGIDSVMTVGEIRLPSDAGTVLIMGMCSDPAQRQELAVLTAFALSMTQYLPEGVEPELPAGAQFETPLDGE
jgi:hypothetical protein